MWDLVGNPEDRFSQNEAHTYFPWTPDDIPSGSMSVSLNLPILSFDNGFMTSDYGFGTLTTNLMFC